MQKYKIKNRLINTESFLLQQFWSNTSYTFKGKSECIDDWIKSGILYVKDISIENINLKSATEILERLSKEVIGSANVKW